MYVFGFISNILVLWDRVVMFGKIFVVEEVEVSIFYGLDIFGDGDYVGDIVIFFDGEMDIFVFEVVVVVFVGY